MTDAQSSIRHCTVCDRPRAQLHARKSKLIPGQTLLLCAECFENKRELRAVIVVVARDPDQGLPVVRDYIVNHRYFGPKIRADELV